MSDFDALDPELLERLGRRVPGTEIAALEVYLIGYAVVGWIAATESLGHASPAGTLDYMHPSDPYGLIVKDFVAWTCGRTNKAAGCDERMRGWAKDIKWAEASMQDFLKRVTKQNAEVAS